MPTDSHVHFLPPTLLESEIGSKAGPSIAFEHGLQHAVYQRGNLVDSVTRDFSRLEVIQSQSLEIGINRLVLSPWVAMLPLDANAKMATEICKRQNYSMVEAISNSTDVVGLAALPMQEPELAITVLQEALSLGLVGAEITPSCQNVFMGDTRLNEFWREVEHLGATIAVHPSTRGLDMDVFSKRYLWNTMANPLETALGAAQLVLNGNLERYPNLKVLLAHGGGVLLSVFGRIEHSFEVRREVVEEIALSPSVSFNKLHYDTITHDRTMLAELVNRVGASQVLLGTDHPFDMGEYEGQVGLIESMFNNHDAELILDGNAQRLFWG